MNKLSKKVADCLNIRHSCLNSIHFLSLYFFTFLACSSNVFSEEQMPQSIYRKPTSSMVPDEEVIVMPVSEMTFNEKYFVEDQQGILKNMKYVVQTWQETELYREQWNLESTGFYHTPSMKEKRDYLSTQFFKYLDKRLTGEIKNAKQGTTFAKIAKVEQTLKPQSTVNVSKNVAVKFKARPLSGKAMMEIRNPFFQNEAYINVKGDVNAKISRAISSMAINAGTEYTYRNSHNDAPATSHWYAFVDHQTTAFLKTRISSAHKEFDFLNERADKRIEVQFSYPFEM